ncbi:hypothetical protein FSP39_000198 [Pinctada imbricata]|uniref:RNA polymerase I-specific transcription initiation factor RRN3 n=1 Tax=Pinctada imbricata TaxID=66713 RepID=A0AA89BVJ5_PINIB|nr:hypothetical protein FSP39_000198 [Pinctada imbricata]
MSVPEKKRRAPLDLSLLLDQYKQGYTKEYDKFLSRLGDPEIQPEDLKHYMKAIRNYVTLIDKEFEILVGIILKLDWVTQKPDVVQDYQSLLLSLLSAHTCYLRAGLRMLVKHFLPKLAPLNPKDDNGNFIITKETRQRDEVAFVNVHMLLKALFQCTPMCPVVLMPLLTDLYPHMTKDVYYHECFIRNLLQTTHYIPSLRQKICRLVVDGMLTFDVRCPRHEIEEAEDNDEEEEDMEQEVLFEMDDPEIQKEITSTESSWNKKNLEDRCGKPMSHKEAHKLDVVMDLTLQYIYNICHTQGKLNWEATKQLYRELLLIFEQVILPTHASCHVQFIMFYLCSLKQAICEGFMDFLWKRIQDPNVQGVFRQAAAGYMGSILSRALFVPISTVTSCLDLLCGWIHKYLDQISNETLYPDIAHHGPFYAVCQAVFYVFVFRNKEIFETKKGYKWAESLNFQRIVTSRLNPLRIVLPVIVKTFASITRMHQLAFCDTIIERNRRCLLPVSAESSAGSVTVTLDSFFPFDPYLLNRSRKFIIPLYREFQGCVEEEIDIEEDEEDDFIQDDAMATTPGGQSLGKTPTDFLKYGISPGFKNIQDIT